MEKIIAVCGIICTECPAFIATKNNDEELRKKTAEEWSKSYGAEISPDDIHCVGCLEEGKHISHCAECEIRKCAKEKGMLNCAYCEDYACDIVEGLLKMVPPARTELDAIRKTL